MSLKIPYPFLEHIELLHDLGFKFVQDKGFISYKDRDEVESKLPEELKSWLSDYSTLYDFLGKEDEEYISFGRMSYSQSIKNLMEALSETHEREKILERFKFLFAHPFLKYGQGPDSFENGLYIGGTLSSFKKTTLSSLFYAFGHFLEEDIENIRNKQYSEIKNQNVESAEAIESELRVLKTCLILCDHFNIERPDIDSFFLEAYAEYDGAEAFFKKHFNLSPVPDLSELSEIEKMEKEQASFIEFHDKVSPEKAEKLARAWKDGRIHVAHKKKAMKAYLETLDNTYLSVHENFINKIKHL